MKRTWIKAMAVLTCAAMVFSSTAVAMAAPGDAAQTTGTAVSGEQEPAAGQTQAETPAADQTQTGESTDTQKEEGTPAQDNAGTDTESETTGDTAQTDPAVDPGEPAEVPAAPEPEPSGFEKYADAQDHWARASLKKAFEDGILKGYEDGTMQPDTKITGAQMITILTRILPTAQSEAVALDEGVWYRDAASKALALGIISNSDVAGLNDKMLRRQAIVMMADAFQLADADADLTKAARYSDFNTLNSYEKRVFATLVNDGYIQGWENTLMLSYDITRAEFITILYRVAEEYLDNASITDYSELDADAVVSGGTVALKDKVVGHNVWFNTDIDSVSLNKVGGKHLVVRADSLAKLEVQNSLIDKLVIAARNGSVNLDCSGIKETVVGSGSGAVVLKPAGNDVGITGDGRMVNLENKAGTVAVLGNGNTIVFAAKADADSVKIYGENNTVVLASHAGELVVEGKNNTVNGGGTVDKTVRYTKTGQISVTQTQTEDLLDTGISGMTAAVSAPATVNAGNYLTAKLALTNPPANKNVQVVWTVNGEVSTTESVTLPASGDIALNYYIAYDLAAPDSYSVSAEVKYTTFDGEAQSVQAPAVTVKVDKTSVVNQVISKVNTTYRGNYTTQWAIDHDLTQAEKEIFVNAKGYGSSSQYLIWVNIGTQHTMVFQGSKGSWKMIRSGLVSTGAKDNTPRGVWQTTYKQAQWAFNTYTVKPVVRFYGGGFAMHSRLYKPGTYDLLPGNSNGVGYPLSHGCVRMQADDIQWIYDNVPNGTTVVVY